MKWKEKYKQDKEDLEQFIKCCVKKLKKIQP